MKFVVLIGAICLAALAIPMLAAAGPAPTFGDCYAGTLRQPLRPTAILAGLGLDDLTRDQKRDLQMRLLTYPWTNKPSGQFTAGLAPRPKGFNGLGLSGSTVATIWARIHAQEARTKPQSC